MYSEAQSLQRGGEVSEPQGPGLGGVTPRVAGTLSLRVLVVSDVLKRSLNAAPPRPCPHGWLSLDGPTAATCPPRSPSAPCARTLTCTDPCEHLSKPGVPLLGEDRIRLLHRLPGLVHTSWQVGDGNLFARQTQQHHTCEAQRVWPPLPPGPCPRYPPRELPGSQAARGWGVASFSIYEGQEETGGASTGGHRKNDRVREREIKIIFLL